MTRSVDIRDNPTRCRVCQCGLAFAHELGLVHKDISLLKCPMILRLSRQVVSLLLTATYTDSLNPPNHHA